MKSPVELLESWQRYEYAGMKPGLGRIRSFLKAAGEPQRSLKIIHIAGTNGKGSTARMLASVLQGTGYRTGLYTSPHLVRLHERIQIDSCPIPDCELGKLVREYTPSARKTGLTFFEFLTGLAFIYFSEKDVDLAVVETGLGGRYDATNIFEGPEICIITDVDYDHRQILGKTLREIAREKAGIVKAGRPVISGVTRTAAAKVLRERVRAVGSELREIGRDFSFAVRGVQWTKGSQAVVWMGRSGRRNVQLSLLGEHQARNCAIVLAAIEKLEENGYDLATGAVESSLKSVRWPGRFDVRHKGRATVILDGAHNPGGMRRFVETWKESIWGKTKKSFVFGALEDKEYRKMVRVLASQVRRVIIVPAPSPRNVSPDDLKREWGRYLKGEDIETAGSVAEGIRRAAGDGVCAVTGSLYIIGEAIREFERTRERRG